MAMRVSLVLDGDAKGLTQATGEGARAVTGLGDIANKASQAIVEGFDKALGKFSEYANKAQGVASANDNVAATGSNVISMFSQVAQKAAGPDGALGKISGSANAIAGNIATIGRMTTPIGALTGVLSLAITLGTTLFGVVDSKGPQAERHFQEHARLLGIVSSAYRDAASSAGEFFQQSKNITLLQTQQTLLALRTELSKTSKSIEGTLQTPTSIGAGEFAAPDAMAGSLYGSPQLRGDMTAFQSAYDRLQASIASGNPDITTFREEIAKVGLAASSTNPALAQQAAELLKNTENAGELTNKISQLEAMLRMMAGTASEADRKLLGMGASTKDTGNQFDKFLKSTERQASAMEAESRSAGLSAGAAARLRAETMLLEAAHQAGGRTAEQYAERIQAVADRYGRAAQAAAESRLKSDVAFERSQIGSSETERGIAERLRGVYGDDYQKEMNGAIAGQMRFNEQLQFGSDIGNNAFKGMLKDIREGKKASDILSNALIGGLDRFADKLADEGWSALWSNVLGKSASGGSGGGILSGIGSVLSGIFGGGGGGSGLYATTSAAAVKFDTGGYTGSIGRKTIAGVVHGEEFVIKAAQTAKHRPLLEAINAGQFPGYEDGGYVGPPTLDRSAGQRGSAAAVAPTVNLHVQNTGTPQTYEVREVTDERIALIARDIVHKEAPDVIANNLADPNSVTSQGFQTYTTSRRSLS